MKKQTAMWTALPNGVRETEQGTLLRLSAFLSPRLDTDEGLPTPTLSQFPDFLNWPQQALSFKVQIGNAQPVAATRVGAAAESALWTALFHADTFVEPHTFPPVTQRALRSYPLRHVHRFLRDRYVQYAQQSPTDYPTATDLLSESGFGQIALERPREVAGIGRFGPDKDAIARTHERILQEQKVLPPGPPDPSADFFQLRRFHQPRNAPVANRVAGYEYKRLPAVQVPEIDFHRMVSLLGQYPGLMRRLGLVHDLEIPLPPGAQQGNTTVQVLVEWTPSLPNTARVPNPNAASPRLRTRCEISPTVFRALPRAGDPELSDGMLPLEKGGYEVVQIDPDGAGIKAMSLADNILRGLTALRSTDTPQSYSVPSLRSIGFTLARVGRAAILHAGFTRATGRNIALNASADMLLDAEDVTRGYAVDAWEDRTRVWHSLVAGQLSYDITDGQSVLGPFTEDLEHWVELGGTSAADDSSTDLFVQESLFRWGGWSLAAPRPGKTIDEDGNPIQPSNDPATAFGLSSHMAATPGSLPRLRFGWTYRLRARAVDLAGNRRPLDDPALTEFMHASPEETYGRFEPVPAPVVAFRTPRTEAESVRRIVLRSNFDTNPNPAAVQRHILPPKTSVSLAEAHGRLDAPGGMVSAAAHADYLSKPPGPDIVPWEGGTVGDLGTPDPNNYDQPFIDTDAAALPYLPDPFARGAALRGLPGAPGPVRVDFGQASDSDWPHALPFLLRLEEGNGAPSFDAVTRVLTVPIPKGEQHTVRLSSHMGGADVPQMGLFGWVRDQGGNTALLSDGATAGSHWMLTPYEDLRLVHAVRQPLVAPRFIKLVAHRSLGDTFARLADRMEISRKSTVQIDVLANWTEPIDPLGEDGPRDLMGSARPFDAKVAEEGPESQLQIPISPQHSTRHEFGDTKYRRVTYAPLATTRFAEFFVERQRGLLLDANELLVLDMKGVVEGTEVVTNVDGTAYSLGDDYTMDYAAGALMPEPHLHGVSVDVAYLVPPITRSAAETTTIDVLNTARPAAPKVLYIVPTFRWTDGGTGIGGFQAPGQDSIQSRRLGNGLRVYLDRPWWSSGEGELLGVVLRQASLGGLQLFATKDVLKPYVTDWAMDPLFESKPTTTPSLDAFPLATKTNSFLTLDERPGASVRAAGHEVAYDPERKLWYCDIEIDAGDSYFPFVRLALARFQPKSLADAHLSRVVLADFIQLAPNRFASVTRDDAEPTILAVSVSGPSYDRLRNTAGPSRVEVRVERRIAGVSPTEAEELSWTPVPGMATVVLSSQTRFDGATVWSGQVTLPSSEDTFRLVIMEFEVFTANTSILAVAPSRRVVYADTIVVQGIVAIEPETPAPRPPGPFGGP